MPLELYLFGMIILGIPAIIVGLVGGGIYGFFRHVLPALLYRRRKRIARETRAAAQEQAEHVDEMAP